MKVSTKLLIGFFIIVALMWGMSFFAWSNFGKLNRQFAAVEDIILPGTLALNEIENTAVEAHHQTMTYILSDDAEAREAALARLNHLHEIRTEYFMYGTTEPEKLEASLAMASKITKVHRSINSLINQKEHGADRDELLVIDRITSIPALLALQEETHQRQDIYTEELATIKAASDETYERSLYALIAMAGAISLLAAAAAIHTTRSIVRPLHALHEGTEVIAQGNLDYKVGTDARDEIGQLSRAFDQMTESLSTSMTSISKLNEEINERKRMEDALQESEKRYRAIFEQGLVSIVLIDTKTEALVDFNDKAHESLGYSREEFGKLKIYDIDLTAPTKEASRKHTVTISRKGMDTFETQHRTKDGSLRDVVVNARNFEIDGNYFALCTFQDITERKQMERQLKQHMEELQATNEKLQELDKMKDSFLSTVSHELRTPLTSIKSFAEILLTYDEDKDTQREFLTIINDESDRLTNLINNFLDLSKIESGRMQWDTTELSLIPVVQNAINITQAIAKQKNLTVDFVTDPDLPLVSCDKDRLVQVVTNLLSNAIKFTPEEGRIDVEAKVAEAGESGEAPGMAVVSVSDTGIGIAPENLEAVFEKFKQVGDTLTDKPQGTGLGLPICKEIIEHYGGRIWVESELGKGSTFSFSLPVTQTAETTVPAAPAAKKAPAETIEVIKRGKTILVVDDEANIRRYLSHELKRKGYIVFEASNGREALDLTRAHHPDLITLDIQMPELNGIDATRLIREKGFWQIPIVAMTANALKGDREKCLAAGMNDYINKPIKREVVFEMLRKWIMEKE